MRATGNFENARNVDPMVALSDATRVAAGWVRSMSAGKSNRPSRTITISPSTTTRSARIARAAETSSGK